MALSVKHAKLVAAAVELNGPLRYQPLRVRVRNGWVEILGQESHELCENWKSEYHLDQVSV